MDRLVLTVPEAARAIGVSPRSYYAAAARGDVPSVRVGRRLLVPRAALRQFLKGGEAMATHRPEQDQDGATEGRS